MFLFQLIQMKMISMLFPTSDLYHHIVTPTLLFMSQFLTQVLTSRTQYIAYPCNLTKVVHTQFRHVPPHRDTDLALHEPVPHAGTFDDLWKPVFYAARLKAAKPMRATMLCWVLSQTDPPFPARKYHPPVSHAPLCCMCIQL